MGYRGWSVWIRGKYAEEPIEEGFDCVDGGELWLQIVGFGSPHDDPSSADR
jgi:hypothetical protein